MDAWKICWQAGSPSAQPHTLRPGTPPSSKSDKTQGNTHTMMHICSQTCLFCLQNNTRGNTDTGTRTSTHNDAYVYWKTCPLARQLPPSAVTEQTHLDLLWACIVFTLPCTAHVLNLLGLNSLSLLPHTHSKPFPSWLDLHAYPKTLS